MTKNLIPNEPNTTPDYYCTWQTQLYASCDGKPEGQRAIIDEHSLFCKEKPFGWAYFYPQAKRDLYFVMDDSWDVPLRDYKPYHGCQILNAEKFSSFANEVNPAGGLQKLCEKIKACGWKGLGLWVCAGESALYTEGKTDAEYWTERLQWSEKAGVRYWKVDWGKHCREPQFRAWLTDLAHKVAPHVCIESALTPSVIPHSDVFRTYDVPAILSIPMTLDKLQAALAYTAENGYGALLNCEDEAYIGAALGCVIGVMRHPYAGAFIDGKADMAFPSCHRNLKTKMTEIIRAVRWHRMAPAFSVCAADTYISEQRLTDSWTFENIAEELEGWWPQALGLAEPLKAFDKTAPAAIARRMPLPDVCAAGEMPFVVCAKNPNGAVSVATLGRTNGRTYSIPKAKVRICGGESRIFGVFGAYESLQIQTAQDLKDVRIYAQDLAGDTAVDITDFVQKEADLLILSGELIEKIGNAARPEGDTSEAGLVLVLQK